MVPVVICTQLDKMTIDTNPIPYVTIKYLQQGVRFYCYLHSGVSIDLLVSLLLITDNFLDVGDHPIMATLVCIKEHASVLYQSYDQVTGGH